MKKFLILAGLLLILPILALVSFLGNAEGLAATNSQTALPLVGSPEKLKALLSQMEQQNRALYDYGMVNEAVQVPDAAAVPQEAGKGSQGTEENYSQTNVQVQGVDEADIVKTDGKYIYQVNNNRVLISKASPPEAMKVQKVLQFSGENFIPTELYVDASFLVVIGSSNSSLGYDYKIMPGAEVEMYPPSYPYEQYVKAIVYDIRDKNSIKQVRELELEGSYVSSRKLGSALYLVANKNIDWYRIMEEGQVDLPGYRDTAAGSKAIDIGLDQVRYFPDCVTPNYMLVAGLDLSQPGKKADVSSYLGSGENIYVSQSALYAAVSRMEAPQPLVKGATGILPGPSMPDKINTTIYKFSLDAGNVAFKASGKVPGTVLNQFSMDAYKGSLRVATTTGDMWRTDEGTSKNNVYVLDDGLKITGKLENIAPGEKIYSARFVQNRAYLVTFKSIDPFFVIDMTNPKGPKVLGALKIPGYSDYLHPVDSNHVLGFGKDTVEQKWTNGDRKETSTSYYQGMKLALFDVTDVAHPVEKFKTVIGDRGTDSPLLSDHKALLFDKNKGLLAFPVTVMEVKGDQAGTTAYGEFAFQGVYVYSFSLEKGFSLKGKITHLSEEDLLKSGNGWYGSGKNVERVLYIGNTLYTVSGSIIKANNLNTLTQTNKLLLPQ